MNFSIDACPKLGDAMMDERCQNPLFYIVRDDLLHPFVNGNKARKLDALLPFIEDCWGTDVVSCCFLSLYKQQHSSNFVVKKNYS